MADASQPRPTSATGNASTTNSASNTNNTNHQIPNPAPSIPLSTSQPQPTTTQQIIQPAVASTADEDVEMNGDKSKPTAEQGDVEMGNTATTTTAAPAVDPNQNPAAGAAAAGVAPAKKDISLREFLSKIDDYAPIIPDAVTAHYLTLSGLPPPGPDANNTPPHLARLIALATQKFIADIAADAYQYSRIRSSNTTAGSNVMGNMAGGVPGAQGVPGAAGGADAGGSGKGKAAATSHLGVQRAGYGGGGQGGSGQGRTVLTMEDLGMAVSEYGVNLKRGEFYR